jgi:hypothetical protein
MVKRSWNENQLHDLKWAIRSRAASKEVEGSETRTSNLKVI